MYVPQFDARAFLGRCGDAVDLRLMEYCDPDYNLLVEYVYVGCGRHTKIGNNRIDGLQMRSKRTEQNEMGVPDGDAQAQAIGGQAECKSNEKSHL